jgi:hypothetical protein
VGCSFVHFEVDRDFIIAIIPDGTAGWRVATTALLSGDTLTPQGFHIHGAGRGSTSVARLRAMDAVFRSSAGYR